MPVVFAISVPVPLTLNILPPGLAAVPRSTVAAVDLDRRIGIAG